VEKRQKEKEDGERWSQPSIPLSLVSQKGPKKATILSFTKATINKVIKVPVLTLLASFHDPSHQTPNHKRSKKASEISATERVITEICLHPGGFNSVSFWGLLALFSSFLQICIFTFRVSEYVVFSLHLKGSTFDLVTGVVCWWVLAGVIGLRLWVLPIQVSFDFCLACVFIFFSQLRNWAYFSSGVGGNEHEIGLKLITLWIVLLSCSCFRVCNTRLRSLKVCYAFSDMVICVWWKKGFDFRDPLDGYILDLGIHVNCSFSTLPWKFISGLVLVWE